MQFTLLDLSLPSTWLLALDIRVQLDRDYLLNFALRAL